MVTVTSFIFFIFDQKMGSNRIAPMPLPAKNTTEVSIEMEPTHLSTGSLHSQSAWTGENDNNQQSVVDALSKPSGSVRVHQDP